MTSCKPLPRKLCHQWDKRPEYTMVYVLQPSLNTVKLPSSSSTQGCVWWWKANCMKCMPVWFIFSSTWRRRIVWVRRRLLLLLEMMTAAALWEPYFFMTGGLSIVPPFDAVRASKRLGLYWKVSSRNLQVPFFCRWPEINSPESF